MSRTALIVGSGRLPALLCDALTAAGEAPRLLAPEGVALEGVTADRFAFEHLARLIEDLHKGGISRLCFAGGMRHPQLDPARIDAASAPLLARLVEAMRHGDDALFRAVIALFEGSGFEIVGPASLVPGLVAPPMGEAPERLWGDADKGARILAALGPLDLGQAAVVAGEQCLGIETVQGTAALLDFVARTRPGSGGVLVKRTKPGQELRIDMPAIGPGTVDQAAAAGLRGIAIERGRVLLIDRDTLLARGEAAGIAVWAEP